MQDVTSVSVPKWPFFLGDAALVGFGCFVLSASRSPLGHWELGAGALCVGLGAALSAWPYFLDHRERLKRLDTEVLGSVGEKLLNLEQLAAQISRATNEWQNVHLQAEKTSTTAKEISDRMAAEVRDFTAFMQKANDTEKGNLRLEVEKLRRAELDWLQVLVHMLDHVYALHGGAVRSGKTGVIEQLTQFRNACQDVARRVGLVAFVPAPGEAFDPSRHQAAEGDSVPAGAVVAEPLAVGFTFQGRIVRPAVVRLAAPDVTQSAPTEVRDSAPPPTPASDQVPLGLETPGLTGS